jgi:hypothetical protein
MTTKVTVSIPRDTDLGADIVTNTFHFRTTTGNPFVGNNPANVAEALRRFYDVVPPSGTAKVSSFMSGLNATPATARFYQLIPGLPDGPPYATEAIVINWGAGTTTYPEEAAACLSYRKVPQPGGQIRNERGRIFLGPLNSSAAQIIANRVRISGTFRTSATSAGARLQTEIRAIGLNVDWIVWSPTTQQEHVIEEVYMDDAFDTIRSRGPAPSARTSVLV